MEGVCEGARGRGHVRGQGGGGMWRGQGGGVRGGARGGGSGKGMVEGKRDTHIWKGVQGKNIGVTNSIQMGNCEPEQLVFGYDD